jgi:hypothetical protein
MIWQPKVQFYNETKQNTVRVLLVGPQGSGKTHFLGTSPSPFVIDCDKGGRTLSKHHIPYVEIEREILDEKTGKYTLLPVYTIVRELLRNFRDRKDIFETSPLKDCRTLCIDSWTALNNHMLFEAMMALRIKDKYGNPKPLLNPDDEKPEWDHYSAVLRRSVMLCKILEDIGRESNVIVTVGVGEKEIEEWTGGRRSSYTKKRFLIEGSFRDQIPYLFDEVLILDQVVGKYTINPVGNKDIKGKSRSGITEKIEDPTFSKLFPDVAKGGE